MRILFAGIHRPNRSPSQRVRMEQFFPALRARGHQLDYLWLLDEADDRLFYAHGHFAQKAALAARAALKALTHTLPKYDRVFVQREAFFLGGPIFEKRFRTAKLIFDFDDAIWIRDVSPGNRALAFLKNVDKPKRLMAMADTVIAGNEYLADYARAHNRNVHVIPTVVDTDVLTPCPQPAFTVGWMGSPATSAYVEPLLPVLKTFRARIVGDARIGEAWSPQTETSTLQTFSVGVMPMPDDAWTRGKCGFKALQYMAVGAVPVVSPVGVNRQIVTHGVNGLHALNTSDWRKALSLLQDDETQRKHLAQAARRTVVAHWSLAAWRDAWVRLIEA